METLTQATACLKAASDTLMDVPSSSGRPSSKPASRHAASASSTRDDTMIACAIGAPSGVRSRQSKWEQNYLGREHIW